MISLNCIPTTPATIRILLVDDHKLIRAALRLMIEADPAIKVVGEQETAKKRLRK
jgi:DNA-binding NarL/FixJ family response regulator